MAKAYKLYSRVFWISVVLDWSKDSYNVRSICFAFLSQVMLAGGSA